MTTAYIGLGSNLGDPRAALDAAIRRLRAEPGLRVIAVSGYYETLPVGGPAGQPNYLNAAVAVETERPPEELLRLLLEVERQFGRVRGEVNAARTLDLDLLLYDDRVINSPVLIVPHPRMHERAFALVPLVSIAPDAVHPTLGKTFRQLQDALPLSERVGCDLKYNPCEIQPVEMRSLAGAKVLVTGSTSGIGRAIAMAFANARADVIVHGRSVAQCEQVVSEVYNWGSPGARLLAADLSILAECDRLASEAWDALGGLDTLVCNAGADTLTGEAGKWSFEKKLEALLAIDLKATMQLARDIGSRMKSRGRGCIVTIGWDQAETGMEGDSGQLFAAVKGAVMCFTRSLALSLAPEVRVNCIAPGWIRTSWGETASETWQDRVRRETPLGIWGLPEDVAAAAVWLASPAASFMTGQTLRVNGGVVRG